MSDSNLLRKMIYWNRNDLLQSNRVSELSSGNISRIALHGRSASTWNKRNRHVGRSTKNKAQEKTMGQITSNLLNTISKHTKKHATSPRAPPSDEKLSSKLALGAGCYWGTQKFVDKDFGQKLFPGSIKSSQVGFMAPSDAPPVSNPTYRQVCTGQSGHIEVLFVELNEPEKHFENLIRFFFQFHDASTPNRQGNDHGFQYASWIFLADEKQAAIAEKVRSELQTALDQNLVKSYQKKKVSTKITPLQVFTKAESAHQEYLAKNPNGYCNHRIRFKNWPNVESQP